jgi:predicted metal-dependent phosphotriesterase family hydrolase
VIRGVMSHEHLLCLAAGPWLAGGPDAGAYDEAQVELAVAALEGLAVHGINAVVDVSPYGDAGRDADGANVVLLREISRRSGVHIVSGTASYREAFSPEWVVRASADQLTARFVADAASGIGDTDVRAGILGEMPTGLGEVTEHEVKGLRAAARAHHETGLAVNTHTTHGTMALEQIDLLTREGVGPPRIVIGHMDNHPDFDYVRRVLDRGVTIAFDSIGKEYWDVRVPRSAAPQADGEYTKRAIRQGDSTRAERLARLVASGFAERIVLSQDLSGGQVHLNPATHGQWGYRYLGAVFLPLLAEHGVSAADIETMLCRNPVRMLTVD